MCEAKPYVRLPNGDLAMPMDECIQAEVARLNAQGVDTYSSCCGHGVDEPFILITGEEPARSLGYDPTPWMPTHLTGTWSITPKG
jgi:hypothetical protein